MPNLAFHIEVLNQVIEKRAAAGDAMAVKLKNPANAKLKEFAVLGAMGPDMLQYMPIGKDLATFLSNFIPSATSGTVLTDAQIATATAQIQTAMSNLFTTDPTMAFELYFNPLGAIYSVLFNGLVIPVWPVLDKATDLFNLLSALVADHSNVEVLENLPTILDQLPGVLDMSKGLKGLPSAIQLMQVVIGGILTLGPWMEMNQGFPAPDNITLDRRYEYLRWHKTGKFAGELQKNATSDNQKAYVFGWLSHLSTSVTAEAFVNNIVGGPYRTHWWRNRLAGNFVDSWTFGFFEQSPNPTMAGDNPTPVYFDTIAGSGWPALCNGGNLQDKFNVGGLDKAPADDVPAALKAVASGDLGTMPSQFPTEINDLFTTTFNTIYPTNQPIVGLGVPAFDGDTLPKAYVGAYAVYWFMTSGRGALGSNVVGPGTGQPEPDWIKNGTSPSSPSQAGVNVGAAICAFLLAIFGALLILGGDLPDGLAALGAALEQPIIDWDTVANELFWLRKTLIDAENTLQDALVMAGLAYPPPVMLGAQTNIMGVDTTLPATDLTPPLDPDVSPVPNVTGVALCKTNSLTGDGSATFGKARYPHQLDKTNTLGAFADLNFSVYPRQVPLEEPTADNLIAPNIYPNKILNGFGLKNGGMLAAGPYPTSDKFFGDAVSNADQVIGGDLAKLPNYNLDGDRGYGWHDWDPKAGSNPANPPVLDVQEA
ncbi:MAG: hypothetical protein V4577_05385 [Bacteroidota bacterium]